MSTGRERVYVRAAIWVGCRVEWPGGGRPQSRRLAVVEKYERLRLRRRLVLDAAGADDCGGSVVAVEADRPSFDVDVAEVIVEARTLEALEVLEATVGGRKVELVEADILWRLVDAVEAV